jgi:hypothetical protein
MARFGIDEGEASIHHPLLMCQGDALLKVKMTVEYAIEGPQISPEK